ncbi:MAG: histidine phosphatase family protein [Anaerolineae bacterium]|nr:histidine phosphatase family protein [Anaerolineae bacterium]
MATDFWLIRHGETDWNRAKRYQGSADQPLNEIGRAQAATLIPRLEQIEYQAAYASDLWRVRETAQIALGNTDQVAFDARLRELSFGIFEGLTHAQIKEEYPQIYAEWDRKLFTNAPHGGEDIFQIKERVGTFFAEIRARHEGQTVLIFGHGGIFGVLLCLSLGLHPGMWRQYHFSNCSVSHLEHTPGGYILQSMNDVCHLDGLDTQHGVMG